MSFQDKDRSLQGFQSEVQPGPGRVTDAAPKQAGLLARAV